jgi:hypothetical protein
MIRSGVDVAFPDYGYMPYAQTNGVKVDQELVKQANIDQNRRNAAKNIVGSAATCLSPRLCISTTGV